MSPLLYQLSYAGTAIRFQNDYYRSQSPCQLYHVNLPSPRDAGTTLRLPDNEYCGQIPSQGEADSPQPS